MSYTIKESRGHNGKGPLELKTSIPLDDRREMDIRTYKQDTGGTIVCRVSVSRISECGSFRTHILGLGHEGDFSCCHGVAKARATPKALHALHQAALNDVEGLKTAVREHYAAQDKGAVAVDLLPKAA